MNSKARVTFVSIFLIFTLIFILLVSLFDMIAGHGAGAFLLAQGNLAVDWFENIPYVDFDAPWWATDTIKNLSTERVRQIILYCGGYKPQRSCFHGLCAVIKTCSKASTSNTRMTMYQPATGLLTNLRRLGNKARLI